MAPYPGRTDVVDVRPSRMAPYPGRTDVVDVRPSRMAPYPGRTDVRDATPRPVGYAPPVHNETVSSWLSMAAACIPADAAPSADCIIVTLSPAA